ncbi:MAG: hypothetical protein Q9M23_08205 [Mariprofundaceae bacterium]|nr:hypothetical protein [Mariprofundaceae bacterium]
MNLNIKNSVAAAIVMMALAPSAFASAQVDSKSLTDVLVSKGVLTANEAKAVSKNDNGKLKLGAKFFLNTTSVTADTTTAAGTTSTKTLGLNVDRAYFTAKYSFNDNWMMRITTDTNREPTVKGNNIFLKYAYVEGKLAGKAAVLRLGQSHTPWIDYEQGLWKHRYVSKVMSDQYKFDDSSDLGIGLKGKLLDGMLGYWVTGTNGQGYSKGNIGTNGNQGIDFNSRVGIYPMHGLTLDFQFRDGYRGTKLNAAGVTTTGVKSTLMQAMATYKIADYRIGFNVLSNKDKARSAAASTTHGGNVSSAYATAALGDQVESSGMALWGTAKLGGGFGGFARYENMTNKLSNGVAGNIKEKLNRYLIGAEYTVTKGINFSVALDNSKLTNRGGVAANERKDTRFGLYSQVKF